MRVHIYIYINIYIHTRTCVNLGIHSGITSLFVQVSAVIVANHMLLEQLRPLDTNHVFRSLPISKDMAQALTAKSCLTPGSRQHLCQIGGVTPQHQCSEHIFLETSSFMLVSSVMTASHMLIEQRRQLQSNHVCRSLHIITDKVQAFTK